MKSAKFVVEWENKKLWKIHESSALSEGKVGMEKIIPFFASNASPESFDLLFYCLRRVTSKSGCFVLLWVLVLWFCCLCRRSFAVYCLIFSWKIQGVSLCNELSSYDATRLCVGCFSAFLPVHLIKSQFSGRFFVFVNVKINFRLILPSTWNGSLKFWSI